MKNYIRKLFRKMRGSGYSIKELRENGIQIGENCDIYTNKIDIAHGFLITIGDNVTISNARLLTHDGSTKKILGYSKVGRIDIGNDVFIGADAIILPGVKIGNKVIVGAGSVVTHDIPDDSVAVGNPARVVKKYSEFINENKEKMKNGKVYTTHYLKKTNEEKNKMREELKNRIGFDI